MNQEARLDYLIDYLLEENPTGLPENAEKEASTFDEKLTLFRGLSNIREPNPVTDSFLDVQDAFLTEWNRDREIFSIEDLDEVDSNIYLFQGDITRLAVDGIVNAANSRLLGCWLPNHNCIDNIIHTRSGVQLRLKCHEIMKEQGRKEPAGKAKLTEAFNLPSKYVIHTVGPYIDENGVSPLKENLLASCYRSTLDIAEKHQLETIAFCCISTGEFNFPNERAAEIAIQTVTTYLKESNTNLKVIFNVFKDEDLAIYQSLLAR